MSPPMDGPLFPPIFASIFSYLVPPNFHEVLCDCQAYVGAPKPTQKIGNK